MIFEASGSRAWINGIGTNERTPKIGGQLGVALWGLAELC